MAEKKKHYTRFEKARIIGARALQLSAGARPLIKTKEKDPIKVARMEFEKGLSPLSVKRKMPRKKQNTAS